MISLVGFNNFTTVCESDSRGSGIAVYLKKKLMERNSVCTNELQNLSAKVVLHAKVREQ